MSRPRFPTARWRVHARAAAISRSSFMAVRPTPGAIPRTGATRCSPPPTSRCGSARSSATACRQSVADRGRQPQQCGPGPRDPARQSAPAHARDRGRGQTGDRRAIAAVAAAHDVTIDVHGGFGRPPKPLTPEAEALFELVRRAGADLGQPIAWQPSGGVCDGNNIAACGVPVVDTMGVRGGKIHSAEEYLIADSLAERAALSALDHPSSWRRRPHELPHPPRRGNDVDAIFEMAKLTGGGFTNLPADKDTVAKLASSHGSVRARRVKAGRRPLPVRARRPGAG